MSTIRQRRLFRAMTLIVFMLLCADSAFAHPQKGEAVGFLTGFRHPISGLDHVLAMVAVGLWGAQLGAPAMWVLPVAFPMVMAFGGMLGLMGVPLPGTEYGIALSAILLGAADHVRSAPSACAGGTAGWVLRHLPRACARNRTAARPKRAALQHGIRHCDWVLARVGDRYRYGPSMGVGTETAASRRSSGRSRGHVLYVEGGRMKDATQSRLPLCAFVVFTFLMYALPAEAHLNSTGMGPFYDGLMHFLMSPEDIVPVLALALLAGLRGAQLRAAGTVHSSHCMVARRSRRTKRYDRDSLIHLLRRLGFSCSEDCWPPTRKFHCA